MASEPARLWAPSRLSNWSFLDHLFRSFLLFEKPMFIVFLFKCPFKMSNFGAQFFQKILMFGNQFEVEAGRFVATEPAF